MVYVELACLVGSADSLLCCERPSTSDRTGKTFEKYRLCNRAGSSQPARNDKYLFAVTPPTTVDCLESQANANGPVYFGFS
jgi:hypothetical protein